MQHSRPASAAAVRPRPSSAAAFRVEEAEFEMPEIKEALDELRLAQNDVTQSVISTVKESNFSPELVIVVTKIVCTIVGEEVPKDLKSAKMKLGIQGLRSRMISKKTCDVSDPDAIMLAKYIRQLSILDMPRTPAVMKLVRWISLYVRVVQMLRRTTKKNRKLVAEYFLNPLLQEESSPTSALDNEMALGKLAARDLVGPAPQTQSNDPIVVLESYLKSLKSLQSNLNSGAQVGPPIIKVDLELTSEKEPFTHSPIFRNVDDTVPIPDETMDDADAWSAALAVPSSTHRLQKIEMRPSARESNSAVVELRLREAENTLLKQQLAESEAAIRSAKEQTSSLSLHVDKATEVLKDHEVILRNSLRSIVDNAKREAEQIGVQMLHSSQSLRSDLVERGSALNNLNSRLEYLSSVSSPIQRPNRANVSQHSLRVAESSDESGHKHFEPSGSSFGSGDTAPEPNSSRTPDVGFEKIQTLQHQSVSHDNLMPKGAHTTQAELSLQMQLHESTLSKAVLLQKLEAQESKLQQLSAQLEEQLQFRERRPQQNDPINVDGLESANLSAVLISRVRELEEEVGALKQSNKHMTVELEKSIKVAKAFESRSHEDEVRYNDASQALTNWKRTAQELGHQVCSFTLELDYLFHCG